jgi:hypothetical protein
MREAGAGARAFAAPFGRGVPAVVAPSMLGVGPLVVAVVPYVPLAGGIRRHERPAGSPSRACSALRASLRRGCSRRDALGFVGRVGGGTRLASVVGVPAVVAPSMLGVGPLIVACALDLPIAVGSERHQRPAGSPSRACSALRASLRRGCWRRDALGFGRGAACCGSAEHARRGASHRGVCFGAAHRGGFRMASTTGRVAQPSMLGSTRFASSRVLAAGCASLRRGCWRRDALGFGRGAAGCCSAEHARRGASHRGVCFGSAHRGGFRLASTTGWVAQPSMLGSTCLASSGVLAAGRVSLRRGCWRRDALDFGRGAAGCCSAEHARRHARRSVRPRRIARRANGG